MTLRNATDLLEYLRARQFDMLDYLASLVHIESPSRVAAAQAAVMELLTEKFRSLGYWTLRTPGRQTGGYLFARPEGYPKRSPLQLLVGHCDTVWSLGTLQTMPLRREDGQMYGPGVYDMKAGLTQALFALQAIRDLGYRPELMPVVLINSDEEIGSRESSAAIGRLARIAERAFILEPPLGLDGKLKTARKGLGRFTLTIHGRAAHAGLDPGRGVSAIVELSYQIQRLIALNDARKGITVNVGMIEGGISPNVVAPESRAVIDVRVLTQRDAEYITRQIRQLRPVHPGIRLEVEGEMGRPPMEKTPRNADLWHTARRVAAQIGIKLEEATAGGGSDGNTTSLYTATLDGLGVTGDGAHAAHEFIFIDKLVERTALLTLLLLAPPPTGS